MKPARGRFVVVVAVLLLAVIAIITVIQLSTAPILPAGHAVVITPDFSFNDQGALYFLGNLSTPSGLLQVFPGSNTIYLSDDQQLDYAALMQLGDSTLAKRISATMEVTAGGLYGDFNVTTCSYGDWNGVDVVLGAYIPIPCDSSVWNTYSGQDIPLGLNYPKLANDTGFIVNETIWSGAMGDVYTQYADLELCYSMNQLHYGDYVDAVKAFEHANSMWNGYGLADKAFQGSSEYTSFKLALDLVAFKELMNNPHTEGSVESYSTTINQVEGMMSELQGKDGGVISNYQVANSQVVIPPNTFENGETTSLFVLAG